jgi:hypothetical protein
MAAKQDELGKVFEEAKTADGYDFNKVTCLGGDVKGSIAVAEKVKSMNDELNELGEHADTLAEAEKAATQHGIREKAQRGFTLPGLTSPRNEDQFRIKSLGELMGESKALVDWIQSAPAARST